MKLGSVDVYANHGVVALGSGTEIKGDLELNGRPVAASASHILVATRGQAGLVRVSLWRDVALTSGSELAATSVTLDDQYLSVFDIERLGVWSRTIGPPGEHRFRLFVDDPGAASRVDVVFVGDAEVTPVAGSGLFEVIAPAGTPVDPSDRLDVILSGHDVPVARLAAALKLMSTAPGISPPVYSFWCRLVGEWARWLVPGDSVDAMKTVAGAMSRAREALSADSAEDQILQVARETLRQVHAVD